MKKILVMFCVASLTMLATTVFAADAPADNKDANAPAVAKADAKADKKATADDEKVLKAVVEKNLAATQMKDVEAVLDTLVPSNRKAVKLYLETAFKAYDLEYKLESFKVVKPSNGSEATVEIVQTTTKKSGPEFKDNKITLQYQMKKIKDKWYLGSTDIKKIEYIEKK